MNSFPIPHEQHQLLALANILVQLPQQDAPVFGADGLKELIQQKKLAELAEFQTFAYEHVSELCLEMVEQHPDEVTVLLWDKELAEECKELLCDAALYGIVMTDTQAEALARAILNAGHELDVNNAEWPPCVHKLLQERAASFSLYWDSKREKFKDAPSKGGLTVFPSSGRPFLSLSDKKSTENLTGQLGENGKKLEGRHLAEAIKDGRTVILDQINQRVAPLDHATLENRCQMARRVRNEQAVQCAPDQLGALLAQLASLVAPGKNRSFALSFSPEGAFNDVHHMTVFLEKSLEKGVMALKVSLYDPELSGDTSHLRVLPEHLVQLSFHDFDLRHAFHPGTVDILNLMLDDARLARSLTEKFQFVPENSKVLVSSVLNALAYGNQYGLDIAANRLAMQHPLNTPIKDLNGDGIFDAGRARVQGHASRPYREIVGARYQGVDGCGICVPALPSLPEALSSTFEAYIEEGLTYEQAAKSLSIPIGTVRSRIFRVRELVQDC